MSYLPELFESKDYATAIKVMLQNLAAFLGASSFSTASDVAMPKPSQSDIDLYIAPTPESVCANFDMADFSALHMMSVLPRFQSGLRGLIQCTWSQVLDSMAEGAEGVALASVLCNRALCYQKMDLHRKALRVSLHATTQEGLSQRLVCF